MIETFHANTIQPIKDALQRLNGNRARVRLFYGDTVTGRSWMDEWMVMGHVGNTTGDRSPILVHNSRSLGGGALLDHCIIGIRSKGGWIYKHPLFHTPEMTTDGLKVFVDQHKGYTRGFKTVEARDRWLQWMRGERVGK